MIRKTLGELAVFRLDEGEEGWEVGGMAGSEVRVIPFGVVPIQTFPWK